MAIKKSELYSSLWASCDELRGGMDASQYKDYVLFMLFIKYVSDKYADSDDFAPPVTIRPGAGFKDMVKLKVAAEAGKHITLEGQEKDVTTAGLARMNMILHDFPSATILSGNTLVSPKFTDNERLRTYDYVVANPPFSDKTWSTGLTPANDRYQRFAWGEPPAKQGDYAYLLHIIRSMKNSTGKAACILPHGVLFRGNAEATIRRELVLSGYLKGIIGLPANLFYGTGIPACILVLDKENATARKGIFMIDASKGFIKDGNKNRLREQDIHRIVDTFTRQAKAQRFARMVLLDEIADPKNDYNLNLPRYIDTTEPEDIQDIDGHLRGGIPERDIKALAPYWSELPSVRETLFKAAGRPGYCQLRLPIAEVKAAILEHTEFTAFKTAVTQLFDGWQSANLPRLKGFDKEGKPKELIAVIAEELLENFRAAPQLDAATATLEELKEEHGGDEGALKDVSTKGDAQEAYVSVLVGVWNEEDRDTYNTLMGEADEHVAQLRTLTDHHFISVLKNKKGNLTLKAVKDRLATTDAVGEIVILEEYLEADEQQKAKTKAAKALLSAVETHYWTQLKADPLPDNLSDLAATLRYLQLLDEQRPSRVRSKRVMLPWICWPTKNIHSSAPTKSRR